LSENRLRGTPEKIWGVPAVFQQTIRIIMFLHHRPIKTVITGKSGSGKTTYFQRLLENGFGHYWQTIFLYDWQGELSERMQLQPVWKIADLPSQLDKGWVIYDPAVEFEGQYKLGLSAFADWTFLACKAPDGPRWPRLFACDEIQLLATNRDIVPEIQTILETGRRWALDTAIVSQQINELHNTFRAQSTEVVTFQHVDPYVLNVIGEWGFDPEQVSSLNTGHYLYRNDRGVFESGRLF